MVLSLVRPLTKRVVHAPIETIVFAFVIATLAYFHLLHVIKHSAFLAPQSAGPLILRPSFAAYTPEGWTQAPKGAWLAPTPELTRVEVQQVVVYGPLSNGTRWLNADMNTPLANALQAGCIRDSTHTCLTLRTPEGPALVFKAGAREAFTGLFHRRGRVQDGSMVLSLEASHSQPLAEMGSGKWIAYAARALVLRFVDLMKVRPARAQPSVSSTDNII
jgi:hydroxymethylglutaryl-CoA reductase (NADPH)